MVSLAAAASVTLGVVSSAFAAAPTPVPLQDDTKKNAGVCLSLRGRPAAPVAARAPARVGARVVVHWVTVLPVPRVAIAGADACHVRRPTHV